MANIDLPNPPSAASASDFNSAQWQNWFFRLTEVIRGMAIPLLQQDLIGNANNYYPNKSVGFVLGYNSNVNNTNADLWQGPTATYVFPAAAQQMQVVSTSANDAAAGAGVRTVLIHYLDVNYNEQSETVTLNGVTPVTTVATNILRINGLHAQSVGTGGVSAGNISLTNIGATVTYGYIPLGNNTARQAVFTIPAGKNGYLTHWQGSSGTATGTHFTRVSIRATAHLGILVPGVFLTQDEQGTLNGGGTANYSIPIRFPPMCDIKMSAISDAGGANAQVMGAMFGWIE